MSQFVDVIFRIFSDFGSRPQEVFGATADFCGAMEAQQLAEISGLELSVAQEYLAAAGGVVEVALGFLLDDDAGQPVAAAPRRSAGPAHGSEHVAAAPAVLSSLRREM